MNGEFSNRTSFAEIIERRAAEQPNKVYLWLDDDSYTYAELRRRSRLAAHGLQSIGAEHGDTVASFTPTCVDAVSLFFGAPQVGALFMAVNTAYKGDYLLHQLRDSRARIVLVDEELYSRLEAVRGELPDLRTIIIRASSYFAPVHLEDVSVLHADVLRMGDADQPLTARSIGWNEAAYLCYTSGTTGPSKGALVTQHYLSATAQVYRSNLDVRPGDVQYSVSPLFHVSGTFGQLVTTLLIGHTTVLDGAFHVSTCWERVRKREVTVFFCAGAMLMMLWSLPPDPSDADLPFRKILTAPVAPEIWAAIEKRYGCEILQTYGQTEAILISAMMSGGRNVPGSAGKPTPLYDIRIVDEDDEDVAVGTTGEVVVRPKANHVMFEGYVGRPGDTLGQMRNLWFHTGDLGRLDDEGNFYFVDRKKDAIRRRGENISSFEVEKTVLSYPDVVECAAFAVPSEVGEDEVMVSVVVAEGPKIDYEKLVEHCELIMPRFALPRYLEVVDALPRSVTGRLQKHVLRAKGVGPGTWDSVAKRFVASSSIQ
jgi:crotonobetaine/carnitine-CoA ligase